MALGKAISTGASLAAGFGVSKSGYADPLSPARSASSSIFSKPSEGRDWMSAMLEAAEEEKRRREEAARLAEDQKRLQEQMAREAAQDEMRATAEREAKRQSYIDKNMGRFDTGNTAGALRGLTGGIPGSAAGVEDHYRDILGNEWEAEEEARQFIVADGWKRKINPQNSFLADSDKYKPDDDPFEFLVKNPDFTDRLTSLFRGEEEFVNTPGGRDAAIEYELNDLRKHGVSDTVIRGVTSYLATNEGAAKYRPIGTRDYSQNPITAVVKDATGNDLLAGLAGVAPMMLTGVGPAALRGGALVAGAALQGVGDEAMTPQLAVETAGLVADTFTLGRGGTALEEALVQGAGRKFATNAATRFGAKTTARIGSNLATDVPLTAASLQAQGVSPFSEEGRSLLGTTAAISAAGGALPTMIPAARDLVTKAGVPAELRDAAVAYAATRLAGGDDEEAARNAIIIGAGSAVARRGLDDAVKQGFGLKPLLAAIQTRTGTIKPGEEPVLGLETRKVGEPEDVLPDEPPVPAREPLAPPPIVDTETLPPAPPHMAFANRANAQEFVDQAEANVGKHPAWNAVDKTLAKTRLTETFKLPVAIAKAIDPSAKFARRTTVAASAAYNFMSSAMLELVTRKAEIIDILGPLVSPSAKSRMGRTAVQAAPTAAATGYALTGDDAERKRAAMALGITSSLTLGRYNPVRTRQPFHNVQMKKGSENINGYVVLPSGREVEAVQGSALAKGNEKLADIIQHPEDYNLSPAQLKAAQDILPYLDSAFEAMNDTLTWAGLAPTTTRDLRGIYQLWSKESLAEVTRKSPLVGESPVPAHLRNLAIQKERTLGDNIPDAIMKHPELRLADDVVNIILNDLGQKAKVTGNAITAKALVSGPEGDGWIDASKLVELQKEVASLRKVGAQSDELAEATDALEVELERLHGLGYQTRGDAAWMPMPGLEDSHLRFAPDLLKDLDKLYPEIDGALEGLLDRATSNIRTLLFSTDLSAWTTQGLMLAATNPTAFVRSAPQLIAASVMGDRFTAKWVAKNPELVRKWSAAGVVNGRVIDEITAGATAKKLPVIHELENRGFGAFLPVARIIMAEHLYQGERLLSGLERGKAGKTVGLLGGNDAARIVREAATWAPAAAGVALANDDDLEGWQKIMAVALGTAGTVAAGKGVEVLGRRTRITPDADRLLRARVSREINRSSGILNKAQMGITRAQARAERTWMFNSPAFTRNMFLALKHALSGTGAEAAQARMYLVRTAGIAVGTMAAFKLAFTGEMDSFDPEDPESLLNPKSFGKADLGPLGTYGNAFPTLSLMRSFMNTPYYEGGDPDSFDLWTPGTALGGLTENIMGRTPLISGQFYDALFDQIRQNDGVQEALGLSDRPADGALSGALGANSPGDALKSLSETVIPLPLQQLQSTGFFPWDKGDPNVNSPGEGAAQVAGGFMGLQANPESRSQEGVRRTDAEIRTQFPGTTDTNKNGIIDRGDLNSRDKEAFDASATGTEIDAFKEETRGIREETEGVQKTAIDRYIEEMDRERDNHIQNLQSLEQAVEDGMPKSQWKQAYAEEMKRNRVAKDTISKRSEHDMVTDDFGENRKVMDPKTGKPREMSVNEYLGRSTQPEDEAVDAYYALFDQASGVGGQVDFDKLEDLRFDYLEKLSPEVRAYVEERLDTFAQKGVTDSEGNLVPLPTLGEYEDVKDIADPFWQLRDSEFTKLQQKNDFFTQFQNYDAFRDEIAKVAAKEGIQESDILASLRRRQKGFKRFEVMLEREQRKMRGSNNKLDQGLQDFYDRPAVNWMSAIASRFGDTQYDNLGPKLAMRESPSAVDQNRFLLKYSKKYNIPMSTLLGIS